MSKYLVLDVACAECRMDGAGTLVTVLGYADTAREARELANGADIRHNWMDEWEECDYGWYAAAGDGELRIIALE